MSECNCDEKLKDAYIKGWNACLDKMLKVIPMRLMNSAEYILATSGLSSTEEINKMIEELKK